MGQSGVNMDNVVCQSNNGSTSRPRLQQSVLVRAIEKLARAGEQAGFTVEEMVDMLQRGMGTRHLLDLIVARLTAIEKN